MTQVRDCLGRERAPEHQWPDGSYTCPFCWAAAAPDGCANPACFARVSPPYPVEQARRLMEEAEQREAEERARVEVQEWRKQYAAERETERGARRVELEREAGERGACIRCLFQPGWEYRAAKFVKHRKACPLAAGRGGQKKST